ncbi:MAG: hypothetical protein QM500_19765 [Methylococcales bacterium]
MFFTEKEKLMLIKAVQFLQSNVDDELIEDFKASGYPDLSDEGVFDGLVLKLEQNKNASFTLQDGHPDFNDDISGCVITEGTGIGVALEGYSDYYSDDQTGVPIFIEKYEGDIKVRIYGDINNDSPTQVISLKEAKNSLRVDSTE